MNSQSLQNNQGPSLYLFERKFEPFLSQSNEIIIQSELGFNTAIENYVNNIASCSVNGCKSPSEFRTVLTGMMDASLQSVFEYLRHYKSSYWQPHIEFIRSKLMDLSSLVEDESIIFTNASGESIHHYFKSFKKFKLVGFNDNYSLKCGQWIRLCVDKFVEVWLQVITDTITRFDLIYDLLKHTLTRDFVLVSHVPTIIKKFDLTVPQIGYFLNLLIKTGTIDVPVRQITGFIKLLAANFQSKKQESIHWSSLRNKYTTPDLSSLDFWENKLKEWLSRIQADRDRLTK